MCGGQRITSGAVLSFTSVGPGARTKDAGSGNETLTGPTPALESFSVCFLFLFFKTEFYSLSCPGKVL